MINYITTLLLALLLFSCSGSSGNSRGDRKIPVVTAVVEEKAIPIYIESIGNVKAFSIVQIKPQVSGTLLESYVKEGQVVKKGDPLYKIDPKRYLAALQRVEGVLLKDQSSLALAKKTVERYSELVKKEYVSKLAYDQYVTNVESLGGQIEVDKADIALAKIDLNHTTLYAPIDGKISLFAINVGNLVTANDPNAITEIRQITPVDVQFTLAQRDFQRLQQQGLNEGYRFGVVLPGESLATHEGEVYFIDNHIDLATGTIILKGKIENKDEKLWPGAFVTIRLFLTTEPQALVVPYAAVSLGQKGPYLFVVTADETVELREVKLGERYEQWQVIVSGVKAGETVVTDGQINLRPGSKVVVK